MLLYTIFTQMGMTNFTIHRGRRSFTQGAAYNILCAVAGIHGQETYFRRITVVNLKYFMMHSNKECE